MIDLPVLDSATDDDLLDLASWIIGDPNWLDATCASPAHVLALCKQLERLDTMTTTLRVRLRDACAARLL